MYSCGPVHMDVQRQDDQLEHTIQQLCADTGCNSEDLLEAMDDREGGERGPEISVLIARHDDDDISKILI